jgi:excisionase family DNA binding protein
MQNPKSEKVVSRESPTQIGLRSSPQPCCASPAMRVSDVAKEMNCSLMHVLNLIHGKVPDVPPLPAVKTGRMYRIRRATFERWLEHCEAEQVG